MIAQLESPVKLRIPSELVEKAKSILNYEEKSVTFEWLKWNKVLQQDNQWLTNGMKGRRHWWFNKHTREELENKVKELYSNRYKSLLFQDGKGFWTYSGFVTKLFGSGTQINKQYELPEFGQIEWANKPEFEPRYYQTEAVDLLCPLDRSRSSGAVEIGTGLGKSYIMALLIKRIGLSTIVIVPTLSIAYQMLKDMKNWFGEDKVGQFFDGKKQGDRFIVVAVSKSLLNVVEDSKDYYDLVDKKLMLCDESHMIPAESLSTIALNLFENIPYRYFFSGTQLRTDGLELVLGGIIGDIVYTMSVEDGINKGFLSKLLFFQWQISSDSAFNTDDYIKMNRVHLHYNMKVNKHAVRLAKYAVSKGRRVLIMIDEVEQLQYLIKAGLLDMDVRFAYGILTTDQKKVVPKQFHKADNMNLVDSFDKGEYPVLVATQALGYGTDIKSVSCIISIYGLSSEIRERQAIGRGTRLFPNKTDCVYNDYNIYNIPVLEKQAKKRRKIYDTIYGRCKVMEEKC
jgi:superfamily II DNA or RNA helicase